jgi:hypothetical protein
MDNGPDVTMTVPEWSLTQTPIAKRAVGACIAFGVV